MRQQPLSGDETEDTWAVLEAMERAIPHPTAKTFWCKHFSSSPGSSSTVGGSPTLPMTLTPWAAFALAFEEEFGAHPEEALERFRNALAVPAPPAAATTVGMPLPAAWAITGSSVMELDVEGQAQYGEREGLACVVELRTFSRRTAEAGGLYELFQQEADPATLVYVMGTVEDDSGPHVASFAPLVLDSFLGYSIAQVCCGGQHAAILTTSGHIYTWGRGGFGRLGHGDDSMCPTPRLVKSLADQGVRCRQVRTYRRAGGKLCGIHTHSIDRSIHLVFCPPQIGCLRLCLHRRRDARRVRLHVGRGGERAAGARGRAGQDHPGTRGGAWRAPAGGQGDFCRLGAHVRAAGERADLLVGQVRVHGPRAPAGRCDAECGL